MFLCSNFREQSRVSSLHLLLSSSVPASPNPACSFSVVSSLLLPSDCVFGVDSGMPMCASAFALQRTRHTRQPEHTQVRHNCSGPWTHFIFAFTSDVSSCTKYRPCAACASYRSHKNSIWSLSFFLHPLFWSLSDPMMTSGSLLPMMCHISSRAGLTLKSQFVMSSAPAYPTQRVALDVRDSHSFLTGSVQGLLRGDGFCVTLWGRLPQYPSRDVLFSGG